jgi:enoyl-CoA hydratase/carnithine racemase
MDYDTMSTKRDGHVGIITINRPPYQVMDFKLLDDLEKSVVELIQDPIVRVIVLTATGDQFFSRGYDIPNLLADPMTPFVGRKGLDVLRKIEKSPKPVIAAINGIALGGGCEMAAACHLRVMVDKPGIFIGQEEVKIGIVPGWGGAARLPRIVGRARAIEMILTYKKLDAKKAYEWGLANIVSKPGEVMEDAMGLARNISQAHAMPLKYALDIIINSTDANILESTEIACEGVACWGTEETLKLMTTFMEKGEKTLEDENYSFDWAVVE